MLYPLSYWSNSGIIPDVQLVCSLRQVDDEAEDRGLTTLILRDKISQRQ